MPTKRRFEAQRATIDRELRAILAKMGATSGRLETDITERDRAATIVFDRDGKRYAFRCAKWERPLDNYRAAQLTIVRLYQALEDDGTTRDEANLAPLPQRRKRQAEADADFDRLFDAFLPPPDDTALLLGDGSRRHRERLGWSQERLAREAVQALTSAARSDTRKRLTNCCVEAAPCPQSKRSVSQSASTVQTATTANAWSAANDDEAARPRRKATTSGGNTPPSAATIAASSTVGPPRCRHAAGARPLAPPRPLPRPPPPW